MTMFINPKTGDLIENLRFGYLYIVLDTKDDLRTNVFVVHQSLHDYYFKNCLKVLLDTNILVNHGQ